ncbi:MAG: ferredoxin family protein [Deltaproteobacteria bacterium]|nr:ferredoxin family protein [Deltaproteobacteria bacterium]
MVTTLVYGSELGGLSSTMQSDLDPFLARLGIGAIGNVALAGTLRTELINGYRELRHAPERCDGCKGCVQVCPLPVWELDEDHRAVLARIDDCTACTACVMQCTSGAVRAAKPNGAESGRGPNADQA